MGHEESIFHLKILGFEIADSIVIQWIVMLVLIVLSLILTSSLKKKPDKKQTVVELFYSAVENLVKENMGEHYKAFIPYVGTLMLFILTMNFLPLIGVKTPTEELSTTLALASISFFLIQGYAIYKVGLGGYLKGLIHPFVFMLPMNLMERAMVPVSLSLRLFANMAAGAVVLNMVYSALEGTNKFLSIGIPVPVHFYFDLFDGVIQMIIFTFLTMVNIKIVSEH